MQYFSELVICICFDRCIYLCLISIFLLDNQERCVIAGFCCKVRGLEIYALSSCHAVFLRFGFICICPDRVSAFLIVWLWYFCGIIREDGWWRGSAAGWRVSLMRGARDLRGIIPEGHPPLPSLIIWQHPLTCTNDFGGFKTRNIDTRSKE